MKLLLDINQNSLRADFTVTENTAQLTLDSETFTAEISEPQPGFFTVIISGKVYQCVLENNEVIVNGKRIPVTIQDPKRLSHSAGANAQTAGRATLTSPMPGKVVRVMCATGDEVTEGQGLFVVEAMKMQNEVQAPTAGKITELKATVGQTVNTGEVLAVIEYNSLDKIPPVDDLLPVH